MPGWRMASRLERHKPRGGDRMRRRWFIMLLARPTPGWPQCAPVHGDRLRLIVTLSGLAYMLTLSCSLSQELASEQQAFNNACRTCHTIKDGDNRLGPNLYKIIGR